MPRSRWWVGLPVLPTWLAWFGEPYRSLVAARLDPSSVASQPSGLLLQCGPDPMDIDQLDGVFPRLPGELLAVRQPGSTVDPAARITSISGPPSDPAEFIPRFD